MKLFYFGLVFLVSALALAIVGHSVYWYSPFVIGGFLVFEGLNMINGRSMLKSGRRFWITWLIFIAMTLTIEFIGNFWLNLWNAPAFSIIDYSIHAILIGYPFTGFFGLAFFIWLRSYFPAKKSVRFLCLLLAALLFGYINEYPNTFANAWVYSNWPGEVFLGIPVLVSALWLTLPAMVLPFSDYLLRSPKKLSESRG